MVTVSVGGDGPPSVFVDWSGAAPEQSCLFGQHPMIPLLPRTQYVLYFRPAKLGAKSTYVESQQLPSTIIIFSLAALGCGNHSWREERTQEASNNRISSGSRILECWKERLRAGKRRRKERRKQQ